MARIRTIKPEFPQSESMGRISRDSRLCFLQMWTLADDEGRLRGNSRMLASLLFPYDDDAPGLIDGWIAELEREHCIVRYEVEGSTFIQIVNWLLHQKIDKPSKSKIPEFDASSRILANPRERSSGDQGSRIKDQGREAEPIGSDGQAVPDTRSELWRAGKSLLSEQGMPIAQCGTFVGRLVKEHGEDVVVDAVRAAVVQRPADAASFLVGACRGRGRKGSRRDGDLASESARTTAEAERMLGIVGDVIDA